MIAGYILTGGQNRRMQGNKKLFLEYRGQPFYRHLIHAFLHLSTIYLSVDTTEPYQNVNLPMVVDLYPQVGPIGGICSGLETCPQEALFVTACDMPHLDRDTVERVIQAYHQTGKLTLVQADGKIQPLLGIYPKSLLPVLKKQIQEKNYRMMHLIEQIDYAIVPLESGNPAADNINTVEEYAQLIKKSLVSGEKER